MIPAEVVRVKYEKGYYWVTSKTASYQLPPVKLLLPYGTAYLPKKGDRLMITMPDLHQDFVGQFLYGIYDTNPNVVPKLDKEGDFATGNFIKNSFLYFKDKIISTSNNVERLIFKTSASGEINIDDKIQIKNSLTTLKTALTKITSVLSSLSSNTITGATSPAVPGAAGTITGTVTFTTAPAKIAEAIIEIEKLLK